MVVMLVLCACSSGGSEPEVEVKKQPTMLDIYVYAPDNPAITRSDNGSVAASDNEKKISSLHIWVFRHSDGTLMGYLNPDVSGLSTTGNAKYQMLVPDEFVTTKPNVDVYVMANVTADNCGLTVLDKNVTRSQLEGILIGHKDASDYYGLTLTTLVTEAPTVGLPMSGVLKNQPVYGEAPVLRIGTSENIAKLQLVRAVSKMRFILSKFTDDTRVYTLTSISLNGSTMPKQEYLFLDGAYPTYRYKVGSEVESGDLPLISNELTDIKNCVDPSVYAYVSGDGREYETKINTAVSESEVSDLGRFYLRESDKKLTGAINYTVGGEAKTATFSMKTEGDFSRNHTWIVYAYFMNGNLLNVNVVDVKSWTSSSGSHEVYNW